jgi:Tol biopolymer transport system component
MNANFKYLIYCFIALLAFSCKEDDVDPEKNLALFTESVVSIGPITDFQGVFSYDGSKIAFFRIAEDLDYIAEEGLYIMNADGSNIKFLDNGFCYSPKFSPDGKKLAYIKRFRLTIIDFETGNKKEISNKLAGQVTLDWSPDGRVLVFSKSDNVNNGGRIIGLIDSSLNENSYKQITASLTGDALDPVFSRDQKFVYFYKFSHLDNSSFNSLQKIDLATDEISIVKNDDYIKSHLSISFDNILIATNVISFNTILWDLDGKFIRILPVRGLSPSFHPNGKSLLISSPDSTGDGVRLATFDLETGKLRFIRYY